MKFVIFVYAALFACAAAQPQIDLDVAGDVVGAVTGGVSEVVNVGGNSLSTLTDVIAAIAGPDGLLGILIESGVGKIIGDFLKALGKLTGFEGLHCWLEGFLYQVEDIARSLDQLVLGLVCRSGVIVVDTLKPIVASVEKREMKLLQTIFCSF